MVMEFKVFDVTVINIYSTISVKSKCTISVLMSNLSHELHTTAVGVNIFLFETVLLRIGRQDINWM